MRLSDTMNAHFPISIMIHRFSALLLSLGLLAPSFAFAMSDSMMHKDMQGETTMKSDTMMKSDVMMKKSMTSKERATMRREARMKKHAMMKDSMMKKVDDSMMMKKDGDSMMKKDKNGAMMKENGAMMMHAGAYKDMTSANLPTAVLTDGTTKVLFFSASWCPVCKTANQTLTSWYADGKGLLTVYKINYDTEKALEQKYGVTYQHTFVKIDGKGNVIKSITGPSDDDLKDLLKA